MQEICKRWNNISNDMLRVAFILILACSVITSVWDLEEVNSIVPALENLSVNWLTAYDVTGVTANNMLYPLQYIGMLLWGMVPFWIFKALLGLTVDSSLILLAMWYKILEIYLLYEVQNYLKKILGYYQRKSVSNLGALMCAFPIIFYSLLWHESWNAILVLFLVMGLYYYLQDKMSLFVLCFLFAILCHPAVLLLYVPMVVWKNKRIKSICDYLICLLLPLGMEFMMFISSAGFRSLLGEVAKQQGWQDVLVWGVCLIISVFAFLDREKKDAKKILYIYIIISASLWLTNGMREGYLVLLIIMMALVCMNNKNVSDKKSIDI